MKFHSLVKLTTFAILIASTASAAPTRFGSTNRWFEVISGNRTAADARTNAATKTFTNLGRTYTGFIATIDSATVQSFVGTLLQSAAVPNTVHVGGATTQGDGIYRYEGGHKAGIGFWNSNTSQAVGGEYNDWVANPGAAPAGAIQYRVYNRGDDGFYGNFTSTQSGGSYIVEFNTVPVPASMPLIATGLGALALIARRRAKAKA